jgi:glycosyltransferase involved in cell wall biosynthesis
MAEPGVVEHRALYAAFDRFPSTKGAGVHIGHMAAELVSSFGGGLVAVLGGRGLPRVQYEGSAEIVRFDRAVPNLIDRAEAYSAWLAGRLAPHLGTLGLCHVRDPWSALPVLDAPGRRTLVYEANGLPYKVGVLERRCLHAADAVVVPSLVIADAVRARGVPDERIHLIRNGADVPAQPPARPSDAPARYVVYVGALQPWQGVDVLLRAFARLADLDVTLVICSSLPERRARPLQRLAERLGVRPRWQFQVPHHQVAGWLAHAELSVAPLTACARNLDQGCSPLKVLESMAAGTAVVASDLPVVRELLTDGEHGRLVPPDRPAELARAIRVLLEYPDVTRRMGERASAHVAANLTWAHARARLADVYRQVAPGLVTGQVTGIHNSITSERR